MFCKNRDVQPYPVNVSILNLCLFSLAEKSKTQGVLESIVKAVSFASNFLGCGGIASHYSVKQMLKFTGKVCITKTNPKSGLRASDIRVLWEKIEKIGLKNLSTAQVRTFVMSIFMHATFCRFSDAASLKLDDILYTEDYFKIRIGFSKCNTTGVPQYVVLPNNNNKFNPHRLMCLYLETMGFSEMNNETVEHVFLFPPLE